MLETGKTQSVRNGVLPDWVPQDAKRYLAHTESGNSIRELARRGGCAPSTVLRQVRKLEQKRDDPLIDEMLSSLGRMRRWAAGADVFVPASPAASSGKSISSLSQAQAVKEVKPMSEQTPLETSSVTPPDDATVAREARRVLRRLSEPGACLAVAKDMEKAVVVRELSDGRTTRTAVLDRTIAQAMALKGWILAKTKGQITRYRITGAGRAALRQILAEEESARAGLAEAPGRIFAQGEGGGLTGAETRPVAEEAGATRSNSKHIRYGVAESPVQVLARRRDKTGEPFLSPDLLAAAERLREDFELAQIGPKVTQNWDHFLTGRMDQRPFGETHGFGPEAAKARVAAALADLGPGLGDVALRCCCYLEGMEQAEKRMGWSARSGKIVLRIALQRLKKHYDQAGYPNLIG